MQMRPSRVLEKLRNGQVVRCTKINLADPRVVEIAALCGFDCVWVDMEHVSNDWSAIENQIRAAKIHNVDTLVRVSKGCYSDYVKPLEADAAGIMVPHVMSAKEAKEIVWQTKFHPLGRRPLDGGNADGHFSMMATGDYIKHANEQRFIIIQIEDPEPLSELEEIAATDGIDMLFFGPADFSQGIGAVGQWDHPEIVKTRKTIAKIARANNKIAATIGPPANFQELVDMGYQFISTGADVAALSIYYKGLLSEIDGRHKSDSDNVYRAK